MKASRKDIAFGAPYRLPPCKDRLVFLLKRQGGVIRTVYPDTAFGAGRSPFHLLTAKSANCQLFCLLFSFHNLFPDGHILPFCIMFFSKTRAIFQMPGFFAVRQSSLESPERLVKPACNQADVYIGGSFTFRIKEKIDSAVI